MCTLEPTKCIWNQSNFCNRFPRYCLKDKDPMKAMPLGPETSDYSLAYLNVVGQRQKDLVNYCSIVTGPNSYKPCTNVVSEHVVNWQGHPNTCFTFESLWGQPDAQPMIIPVTGKVIVELLLHPEEYVFHYESVKAHVMVHDSRALDNPTREGITLLSGRTYNIYVSQKVTLRLPAPYRTNCTNYPKLWRENGGRGPLTRKSCLAKCKMERMLQIFGCVPQSISYPNNNTICDDNRILEIFPSLEIVEGCSRECADACVETTYHLRVEVDGEQSLQCAANDTNCKA
ncbi:hypothetical protein JTE90_023676 [Oedothorax gibbosus]|uniref:Uncharacterized protein n=1 Tax=Oedothorax gibbosus TaxID=931172 RepID=A0AAV6TZ83_9ARAC|nr:hypothetical protein JTE90_023676 [Oedothorax gibbosus]